MSKRISRFIACTMLVIGVVFLAIALNNPQLNWPWNNIITRLLYFAYLVVMVVLFIAPFKKKK